MKRTTLTLIAVNLIALSAAQDCLPVFMPTDQLPPCAESPMSEYLAQQHQMYGPDIIMSNPAHHGFNNCMPPPPDGGQQSHQFGSRVNFEISLDRGNTWMAMEAEADCLVMVRHRETIPGTRVFDTEMLQLNIQGGTLPPNVRVRESPTLPSAGVTRISSVAGGFRIDSFFDISTELSLDGGLTWMPANTPGHVCLQYDTQALMSGCGDGDGSATVLTDMFGSAAGSFADGFGGDEFDPRGAFVRDAPTFSNGSFFFVPGLARELFTSNIEWPDALGFNPDVSVSLTRVERGQVTDRDNDGQNDYLETEFDMTAPFSMNVKVIQEMVCCPEPTWMVTYVMTNTGLGSADFSMHRVWDIDQYWSGSFTNEEVGVAGNGDPLGPVVFQREFGAAFAATTMGLSSSPSADFYYGGKQAHIPTGGGPAFGFGTDVLTWNNYGMPLTWRNYVAFLGYNIDGASGAANGDGHIALEHTVNLAAGETKQLTYYHVYGGLRPTRVTGDVNCDGCVDDTDLAIVLSLFGTNMRAGDVNLDGIVDDTDLAIVLANFGLGC